MRHIPYVSIIEKRTRRPFAVVEPLECWFEMKYYGVGAFQIKAPATASTLASLQIGNYVSIPHKDAAWVIEGIKKTFTASQGAIIIASGREAKAIIGKRIIYGQTLLAGDLVSASFGLIRANAGSEASAARKIDGLGTLRSVVVKEITETQVSNENLLTYTDGLSQSYECGARLFLEGSEFIYEIYDGVDRSGEIIFSQSFDNLLESEYESDETNKKTFALIGGEGEGSARILAEYNPIPAGATKAPTGIDRAEIFVDAKDISSKYKDANGEEKTLDLTTAAGLSTYKGWLTERGKEHMAEYVQVETFDGKIDVFASGYVFGEDYNLGDRVRVQDEIIGVYITPRILKVTISYDREGYGERVEYGG